MKQDSQASPDVATIEVVGVEQAADRAVLEGAHLDRPKVGPIEGSQLLAAGWVLGREAGVVAIEVAWGDRVLCRAPLSINRPDVVADYPDAATSNPVGFRATVEVGRLPPDFSLQVTALLDDGSSAAVGAIVARRHAEDGASTDSGRAMDTPSLRPDLHELLSGMGGGNGTGLSNADIAADVVEHEWIIGELELEGKAVLHVGSGRGATSRRARLAGAELVDGFEPDQDLVIVARLLNAYHGATRVSFFARDLADPRTYAESYDVVLAVSVADLLEGIAETLLGITGLLVADLPAEEDDAARLLSLLDASSNAVEVRTLQGPERRYVVVSTTRSSRGG